MRPLGALVVGLSGQEVERVAALLGEAALHAGQEVRVATDRPVAHLGASVRCQVRIAPGELASPFIPEGGADLLLGLERLEALRWVHEVLPGGLVAVADRLVPTPRMRLGLEAPPADLLDRLRARVARTVEVAAEAEARALGRPGCAGGVLLGLAAPLLPIAEVAWDEALRGAFSGEELAAWRQALARGRALFGRLPDALRRPPEPRAA